MVLNHREQRYRRVLSGLWFIVVFAAAALIEKFPRTKDGGRHASKFTEHFSLDGIALCENAWSPLFVPSE
jgi:hypothetical protein